MDAKKTIGYRMNLPPTLDRLVREIPASSAMAEAAGVRGIRLEDPRDVEAGVAAALVHNGPVLVDAVVNRTELAMPPLRWSQRRWPKASRFIW